MKSRFIAGFLALAIVAYGFTAILFTPSAQAAVASDWESGHIIGDDIFYNPNDMSVADIQNFLNARVPTCDTWGTQTSEYGGGTRAQYGASRGYPAPYICLKNYYENPTTHANNLTVAAGQLAPVPSGAISSAQIINNAATTYGISARALLVLLQKESSGPLPVDDWPFPTQYRNAMGYGCPDTAPCDPSYAGFYNQVTNAARQFGIYKANPTNYRHVPNQTNAVLYNPVSSCGSSNVFIQTYATAGLYDYTPYQPNAAALANLYGTGNSCSAYGNRNFWRIFTDWFGPTTGNISLARGTSSPTVFVLYDGHRQGIPSPDVLTAWGLGSLPIITLSDSTLGSITDYGVLTRVAKNPHNPALYLMADNGGTFDALSNMITDWGYNSANASIITNGLVAYTHRLGSLGPFATSPSSNGVFLVDGGTKKVFSNPNNLSSWAGATTVVNVSDDLANLLNNGPGIFTNQVSNNSNDYIAASGKLLPLSSTISPLYPRNSVQNISASLYSILPRGSPASRLLRNPNGTIFLMDAGKKHGLASWSLLEAYAHGVTITQLSNADLSSIPTGAVVATRFAFSSLDSSLQYFVSQGTYTTPPTFNVPSYGFAISTEGLALLGSDKGTISCAQGLIQATGSAGVYIMDNGYKRGVSSLNMLGMIINSSGGRVCQLTPQEVSMIPTASPVSAFVSNGGNNYVIEQDSKYIVDNATKSEYGISGFTPVSDQLISNYTDAGSLVTKIRVGNSYVLLSQGRYFQTASSTIASLWGISSSSQPHSSYLLSFIPRGGALTQFAMSSDASNGTIYVADGHLLPLSSINHLFNAGYNGQGGVIVSPSYIAANIGAPWQGYLAENSSGSDYVLEGGKKHRIPDSLKSLWLGTSPVVTPTPLSDAYLSLLSTSSDATKSITDGNPGIYAMIDGKKSGIPNLATYLARYSPALTVDPHLIQSIQTGSPAPSI